VYAPGYVRVNLNTRLDFVHAASRVYLRKRQWTKEVSASARIKIIAADGAPDGLELEIPPDALVDPLGCLVSGPVNVHVTQFALATDLARFPNPPVHIDDVTRTPIPIQMAGLVAIEIEKGQGESARPLMLIQSEATMMHVTMPVDRIVDESIGLTGAARFAQ
jgi:hypothetical protein